MFAYTQEIDAWLLGGHRNSEPSPAPNQASRPAPSRLALLITAVLLLGAAAIFLRWNTPLASALAHVLLRENRIEGTDNAGAKLWNYPLPEGFAAAPSGRVPKVSYVGEWAGRRIALTSVPRAGFGHGGEDEVFCFSEDGKLLWRFAFRETLTFGAGDYGPPWYVREWKLQGAARQPEIALAFNHDTWWPSVLVLLDSGGRPLGEFVNSGSIFALGFMEAASGPLWLAGGVRNQEDEVSGMLAILDGKHPSGSSPESEGSRFECKSCPPGRPLRYFVFPRSELNKVMRLPYNDVTGFRSIEAGFQVHTTEAYSAEAPNRGTSAQGIFEFSPNLRLKRASYGDDYRVLHKMLEAQGKISHSWDKCPDRNGPRLIRAWNPERGWTEARPGQ